MGYAQIVYRSISWSAIAPLATIDSQLLLIFKQSTDAPHALPFFNQSKAWVAPHPGHSRDFA